MEPECQLKGCKVQIQALQEQLEVVRQLLRVEVNTSLVSQMNTVYWQSKAVRVQAELDKMKGRCNNEPLLLSSIKALNA